MEWSRLTRNGIAELVSRDQILRQERGQENIHFSCSADHEQDWQPDPVDPYSCNMCNHTYMHAPDSHTQSPHNCLGLAFLFFLLPCFVSLEIMSLIMSTFAPLQFSLCMKSTS